VSSSFDLKAPELFTAGTVGPPGQRTFYLQAREAGTLVTLKAEKEHVGALGEYLGRLLTTLPAAEAAPGGDPALREPIVPAWAVGSIAVGYDEGADRIVIVAEEATEEDEPRETASVRFAITRAQAAAFAERARMLIEAGRPTCRVCGRAVDPGGHVCARGNGHGPITPS
jgi:uncharacterized repeat protein (TIGR03847 family)